MLQEHRIAKEGGPRETAFQEKEFILGGQFNEDGTTRLEVVLLASEGKTKIELRLLGCGEGIGWYIQRRIQLDTLQIGALRAILGRGAGRVKSSAPQLKMTCKIAKGTHRNPQGLGLSLCP
ncbi:hypothetical protein MELA_00069 [Candidatus Methylomirabilis lanthanidiphila]|uniref:Uncharacterized protein n=1 Tax=Candidatus Methylomirabilis lanthanidiphila TaxID=2211376 RepID=A0A564ZEX1_9BACT|nr:hypothetical protein [Candidatus Methylomirabilis lanthanidiphila]VUZ83716.1 hypothetical protein MELA_00069 [Candidatus Methylomirabilis lanthanidiphila]